MLRNFFRKRNPSYPILTLSERAVREQLSPGDLQQQVNALLKQGVGLQDIQEALQIILDSTSPTPLVEAVGQIRLSCFGHAW